VAAAPVLVPATSGAGPAQPEPPTERGDAGLVTSGDDDVLRADSAEVAASLGDLSAEVQAQVAAVVAAQEAEATAQADLAAAEAAVAETQASIDALGELSDEVVIESFINPPAEDAMDTLNAETLADATVKQSILTNQSNSNAEVLTDLQAAEAELVEREEAEAEAAATAEEKAADSEAAVDDLIADQSQETLFVLAVQDRLAGNLAEADALAGVDPAAAEALRAREGELAGQIDAMITAREQRAAAAALQQAMAEAAAQAAAARAARPSGGSSGGGASIGPASGNLSTVSCPAGGSITVDSSLAGNLQSMLDAAAADGNNLCGGGYRDPSAQIALRRANCGSSNYAIYEAPSSACSPPTARPGTSNHEQGLAIDFTCNGGGALGSSSSCFTWLKAHAASYGLYNLPSEPWHWSNDGT
jgi:LAS superfamily LD-carboxypeptidase LdcB